MGRWGGDGKGEILHEDGEGAGAAGASCLTKQCRSEGAPFLTFVTHLREGSGERFVALMTHGLYGK